MKTGFVIRAKLPSLNEYTRACRSHWAAGAAMKADVESIIQLHIRMAIVRGKLAPVQKYPALLSFRWHERTRKRDPDNIFSAKKFILDAMQKAGIIGGDSQKYIRGIHDDLIQDAEDYVEVLIETEDESNVDP